MDIYIYIYITLEAILFYIKRMVAKKEQNTELQIKWQRRQVEKLTTVFSTPTKKKKRKKKERSNKGYFSESERNSKSEDIVVI